MELLSSPSQSQPFSFSFSQSTSLGMDFEAVDQIPRSRSVPNQDQAQPDDTMTTMSGALGTRGLGNLRGARREQLLSRMSIRTTCRKYCCARNCLRNLGFQTIQQERQNFFCMKRRQQNIFLRSCVRTSTTSTPKYAVSDFAVCRASFLKVFGICNQRVKSLISTTTLEGFPLAFNTHETPQLCFLRQWLENFVLFNGEVLPNSSFTHLPDNFTKREVYNLYVESTRDRVNHTLSLPSFLRIWRQYFSHVKIPKKSRMGVCQICAELKAKRDTAKSAQEKVPILQALKIHREQQSTERQKLAKHRKKCLEHKEQYLGLVIDGMDQKKTMLPHFIRSPKNLKEENFIQLHVVGALVFNGVMSSKVFINFPNIHNDPNLTVTIIQKLIGEWPGDLPSVLYLQLDNTSRENKNQVLLAYLNMLVHKKIFKKIKLGFLLVGHTHDQIDQMFSRFSVKLAKKSAFDLPQICSALQDAYIPHPSIEIIEETYDFRSFAIGDGTNVSSFVQLNDHSFQHQFKIEQREEETLMWCKKYSNSDAWLPEEGLKFLLFVPQHGIARAKYMLISSMSETVKSQKENRPIDFLQCLTEIKETIYAAHVYFPASPLEWWETFFVKQEKLIEELENDAFQLVVPFVWCQSGLPAETNTVATSGFNDLAITEELLAMVHGETREMYVGPRKTTKRRQQEKEMWEGNVNELCEGTMIAVLATNDENNHPFWLAKVTKVFQEHNVLSAVEVHWYRTAGEDPLKGKYDPEMLKQSKKGKKSGSHRRVDTLNLQDVEILVYGFDLKKSGHLRQKTIEILKQKVNDLS